MASCLQGRYFTERTIFLDSPTHCLSETGSHYAALVGMKLIPQIRLALNSGQSAEN